MNVRTQLLQAIALLLTAGVGGGWLSAQEPSPPTPGQLEFFEKKIRPIFVTHCYQCHSADAKNIRGSLLVDSQAGLLKGGDSGPAIVPGKPQDSLLIDALKHESFEMPPSEKLPEEMIDDFVKWIEMGAPDPRTGPSSTLPRHSIDLEAGRKFWSFQPLRASAPPDEPGSTWPRSDLDRWILARQKAAGLTPAPDANPLVLLRRVYFDLVGLPPTPDEIHDFEQDLSPLAFERVVDRLLQSPRFGERWGRHWLDLARYADSTGGGRSMLYEHAWRYRDYVIDAFNRDKPFDQFIIEQLAGDLLPYEDFRQGREQLTATAFLALGPTNYEEQDKEQLRMDAIDEQIETVGRVFLAMTLGCARCHDHKFDPIPTADYYALAGIFRSTQTMTHANVSHWVDRELPLSPDEQQRKDEFLSARQALAGQIADQKKLIDELKPRLDGFVADDDQALLVGAWKESKFHKTFVGRGYRHSSSPAAKAEFIKELPAGRYQVEIAYNGYESRSSQVEVRIAHAAGETIVSLNQQIPPEIDQLYHRLGEFEFADRACVVVQPRDEKYVIIDAVRFVPQQTGEEELVALKQQHKAVQDNLKSLEMQLQEIDRQMQEFLPQTLSVREEAKPGDYHICIRGNVKNLGPVVPRGFLSVATPGDPLRIPESVSGRLELARWIASPDNPLTSRVLVNRVWSHLFGKGLVRTVDNFGEPGERPSHPELLDHLALGFMNDGWSVKRLIRRIVLSRTYRLDSKSASDPRLDPENRLLAHQNRRRLDAESLLDTLLLVSGELTPSAGGNTIRPGTKSELGYTFEYGPRAVYLPVFRNQLPDLFSVFDFPDPNLSLGQRTASTLSTQALFLLNSPFVMDRAESTAHRICAMPVSNDERLEWLTQSCYGRLPTPAERDIVDRFLHGMPAAEEPERWTRVCQAVLGSISLRYVE